MTDDDNSWPLLEAFRAARRRENQGKPIGVHTLSGDALFGARAFLAHRRAARARRHPTPVEHRQHRKRRKSREASP